MINNSLDLGGCEEDVAYPWALIECLFQIPVTIERENWRKPANKLDIFFLDPYFTTPTHAQSWGIDRSELDEDSSIIAGVLYNSSFITHCDSIVPLSVSSRL